MAGRLILPPTNPSLDGNGNPDSGATLTFYADDTTTLQSIYSAQDLLTPLSNPLSCDAAGRFPQVWAPNGSSYYVKWTRTGGGVTTYPKIKPTASGTGSTRQVLTSGTAATYTTPAGCTQLRIRMIGGGGGGGGSGVSGPGTTGGDGGDTIFNGVNAGGGKHDTGGNGGQGGLSATGSPTGLVRIRGTSGGAFATNPVSATTATYYGGGGGGPGGGSGGQAGGIAGAANTGGGGGSGGTGTQTFGANMTLFGGAGSGENTYFIIDNPDATYVYTVGAGGTGGAAGTGGNAGAAGGSGIIIVDQVF